MKSTKYLCFFIFCITYLIPAQADEAPNQIPEIHLLVDVSASMVKADPQNLRLSGVQQLAHLLRQKAKLNLASFAAQYKELIPVQMANAEYETALLKNIPQLKATKSSADLNAALKQAGQFANTGKKIIILFTDGQLNLGSKPQTTQSRLQLTQETLSQLQQNGVQIHVVGLSTQSDKPLLTLLSLKTNGQAHTVSSLPGLIQAIGSITDAIPNLEPVVQDTLISRSIRIDKINPEFTLILKKNYPVTDLYLKTPNGTRLSVAKENNGILNTPHYEMIQKNSPWGEWVLSGPAQQMQQTLLVTDVTLQINLISSLYFNGEFLPLIAYLEQDNRPITSEMAFEGMEVTLELKNARQKFSYVIPYNLHGLFENNLILDVPEGTYEATWTAKSNYLLKEVPMRLKVNAVPFELSTNAAYDAVMVKLLKPELIQESTVAVRILYENKLQHLKPIKTKNSWILNFASLCKLTAFTSDNILIEISAQETSKRDLLFKLLLTESPCTPNQKPLAISQLAAAQNPVNPITKKEEKKDSFFKKHYFLIFSLLFLLITGLFIYGILRGIRYKKGDKEQDKEEG